MLRQLVATLTVTVLLAATVHAAGPALDLAGARLVDLTHTFDATTIYWPTSPSGFELKQLHHGKTKAGYFYSANTLCAPEHGGTHLDAPIHFADGRWSTAEVPLAKLVAPAIVIDVRDKTRSDPDYRLSVADVEAWEAAHGPIAPEAIVVMLTGWSEHWPDRKAYLGDDTPGDASHLHFPSYGEAAAKMLVEERQVSAIGVDTASIDHGPSTDFPVHRIAAASNVIGLENLTNLEQLPATGAWIAALPMKIAGGSGGPLRAIALLPR